MSGGTGNPPDGTIDALFAAMVALWGLVTFWRVRSPSGHLLPSPEGEADFMYEADFAARFERLAGVIGLKLSAEQRRALRGYRQEMLEQHRLCRKLDNAEYVSRKDALRRRQEGRKDVPDPDGERDHATV